MRKDFGPLAIRARAEEFHRNITFYKISVDFPSLFGIGAGDCLAFIAMTYLLGHSRRPRNNDPFVVQIVKGFHGGGGSCRIHFKVNLTASLERVASGTERRPM